MQILAAFSWSNMHVRPFVRTNNKSNEYKKALTGAAQQHLCFRSLTQNRGNLICWQTSISKPIDPLSYTRRRLMSVLVTWSQGGATNNRIQPTPTLSTNTSAPVTPHFITQPRRQITYTSASAGGGEEERQRLWRKPHGLCRREIRH